MPNPAPLWSRNFFLLWQGNAVSLLGTQVFHLTLMLWAKGYIALLDLPEELTRSLIGTVLPAMTEATRPRWEAVVLA